MRSSVHYVHAATHRGGQQSPRAGQSAQSRRPLRGYETKAIPLATYQPMRTTWQQAEIPRSTAGLGTRPVTLNRATNVLAVQPIGYGGLGLIRLLPSRSKVGALGYATTAAETCFTTVRWLFSLDFFSCLTGLWYGESNQQTAATGQAGTCHQQKGIPAVAGKR